MSDDSLVTAKLIELLQLVLNPLSTPASRVEAQQIIEDFKDNSPDCAKCGVLMVTTNSDNLTRHFGLQLIEHSIKFRWVTMSTEEKVFIKSQTIELLTMGMKNLNVEMSYIKSALCRLVVEMIKREWPQNWPDLMSELAQIRSKGLTQTELVLMILERLAEDVICGDYSSNDVPKQRRKELTAELSALSGELLNFFTMTLVSNFTTYLNLKDSECPEDLQLASSHSQIAIAVLSTLTAYLDWIPLKEIISESLDSQMLNILCEILTIPGDNTTSIEWKLRIGAVECLHLVANRKGKTFERKSILYFFTDHAINNLMAHAMDSMCSDFNIQETQYIFLKKLCQLLITIGNQYSTLLSAIEQNEIQFPTNFEKYLRAVFSFSMHPSQLLSSYTQTLWAAFLRHDQLCKHPALLQIIPELLQNLSQILIKIGFPSQSDCQQSAYAKLDFDCDDDEFNSFFLKYRMDMSTVIRLITVVNEKLAVECSMNWFSTVLSKNLDTSQGYLSQRNREFCEWEACQVFLENVMSKLENVQEYSTAGCTLLKNCINYQSSDPLILSSQLSCLSSLFIFTQFSNDILPLLIEKIFAMVVFQGDNVMSKGERTRSVRNVRRHACGVFIKISKIFPNLLLPAFDQLKTHIENLSNDINELSTLESCTLVEALIIISNKHENFELQSNFISGIMTPIVKVWNAEIKGNIISVANYMNYIGLDSKAVEPSSADICGINRSKITRCINTLRAVLLRSRHPDSHEVAIKGGFCTAETISNIQNPATQFCLPMLEHLLAYTKTSNDLWSPENISRLHPDFSTAYEIHENEKRSVLGMPNASLDSNDSTSSRSPQQRMIGFLSYSHDICCFIMGSLGDVLRGQFYKIPQMPMAICNTMLSNLEYIPDYKLRMIIRGFLKPITASCPKEDVKDFLLPILSYLCPIMLERLILKWKIVDQQCDQSGNPYEGEDPESSEILNALLTRQLTREYIDYLANLLYDNKNQMEVNSTEMHTQNIPKEICDLGILILDDQLIRAPFVLSIFNGIVIKDTHTAVKCLSIGVLLVKHLEKTLIEPADALHLFRMLLQSIQIHGQHDAILPSQISLGLFMYEDLRPMCPGMFDLMLEIPSCTKEQLEEFERKLPYNFPDNNCVVIEKRRKDIFKNLISDIIGKNIGQAFTKKAAIDNLPPMYKKSRHKYGNILVDNTESSALENLFS